uniref:Uncharacterized protein n=1 Tax=Vespula pensylvanica TaxID=30213 RepID=A0A834U8J5_VESPE|nr:hypothetical protein H0235_009472 [Vespula pensylvanica]
MDVNAVTMSCEKKVRACGPSSASSSSDTDKSVNVGLEQGGLPLIDVKISFIDENDYQDFRSLTCSISRRDDACGAAIVE